MIINKSNIKFVKRVSLFFIIFYIVGVIGFVIPKTFPFFVKLIPFALLLSSISLFIFHSSTNIKRDIALFTLIFSLSFIIESIGVNTGYIFGNYKYGDALGFKLYNTPLLIGINWLFLTYTATSISVGLKTKKKLIVFVAPFIMLIYDIVLEQAAPKLDMWTWQNPGVPIRNYISWYIISFGFVFLLNVFKIKTENPLALTLFICQFVFFVLLTILL